MERFQPLKHLTIANQKRTPILQLTIITIQVTPVIQEIHTHQPCTAHRLTVGTTIHTADTTTLTAHLPRLTVDIKTLMLGIKTLMVGITTAMVDIPTVTVHQLPPLVDTTTVITAHTILATTLMGHTPIPSAPEDQLPSLDRN